jgi:small subunit ribosomal protein S17
MSKPEKKVKAAAAKAAPAPAVRSTGTDAAAKKVTKTLTGKVVSNKMQKTITVSVERYVPHPEYGKYQRRTTTFLAHDENNESREGDVVAIEQCRPLSRHKSWRLVNVVSRAQQMGTTAAEATP